MTQIGTNISIDNCPSAPHPQLAHISQNLTTLIVLLSFFEDWRHIATARKLKKKSRMWCDTICSRTFAVRHPAPYLLYKGCLTTVTLNFPTWEVRACEVLMGCSKRLPIHTDCVRQNCGWQIKHCRRVQLFLTTCKQILDYFEISARYCKL